MEIVVCLVIVASILAVSLVIAWACSGKRVAKEADFKPLRAYPVQESRAEYSKPEVELQRSYIPPPPPRQPYGHRTVVSSSHLRHRHACDEDSGDNSALMAAAGAFIGYELAQNSAALDDSDEYSDDSADDGGDD